MTALLTDRRAVLAAFGGLALSGCATAPVAAPSGFAAQKLAPLRMEMERLTKITVCLRPFREAGPRLDVETIGAKRVVHNYGHGGSGWSLAWGSSEIAAQRALEGGAKEVAVIGCGALGLTSALTLQRAGAKVTIYAKERAPQTRSARATGTWSPDSRVADAAKVSAEFPALWERMARISYATYQTYLGMPGNPVEWTDRYNLWDSPVPGPAYERGANEIHFFENGRALNDIVPRFRDVAPGAHPFPVARVRHGTSMQFNVAELMHLLTADFLTEGGAITPMEFHTPADLARLPQPVVVNCTGYGAKALFKDDTITPVRGQIAWLAPQPEVHYGLRYRGVSVLPRPDGIVVQSLGESEMFGYGIESEAPDPAEAQTCIERVATLFARASA